MDQPTPHEERSSISDAAVPWTQHALHVQSIVDDRCVKAFGSQVPSTV